QRLVLGLEQVVGHLRSLEHREREGRAAPRQGDDGGGEERELGFRRAGVDVGDATVSVGGWRSRFEMVRRRRSEPREGDRTRVRRARVWRKRQGRSFTAGDALEPPPPTGGG